MGIITQIKAGVATVANSGGCAAWYDNSTGTWTSPSGHTISGAANWADRRYSSKGQVSRSSGAGSVTVSLRNDQGNQNHPQTQLVFLTDVKLTGALNNALTCTLSDPVGSDVAQMTLTGLPSGPGQQTGYMNNVAFLFDRPYDCRYVRLEFTSPAVPGILQFARYWSGPCLYRARGVDRGWQHASQDYSLVSRLPSGVVDVDTNELHRVVRASFTDVTKVEAFGDDTDVEPISVDDLGRFNPRTREVVLVPTCDNLAAMSASAVIGFLSGDPSLKHGKGGNWSVDFQVTEGR